MLKRQAETKAAWIALHEAKGAAGADLRGLPSYTALGLEDALSGFSDEDERDRVVADVRGEMPGIRNTADAALKLLRQDPNSALAMLRPAEERPDA